MPKSDCDVDGVFTQRPGNKTESFYGDRGNIVDFFAWLAACEIDTKVMYGIHPVEEKTTAVFAPIEGGILDLFKQQGINHGDRCRVTFECKMRGGVPYLATKSVVKL